MGMAHMLGEDGASARTRLAPGCAPAARARQVVLFGWGPEQAQPRERDAIGRLHLPSSACDEVSADPTARPFVPSPCSNPPNACSFTSTSTSSTSPIRRYRKTPAATRDSPTPPQCRRSRSRSFAQAVRPTVTELNPATSRKAPAASSGWPGTSRGASATRPASESANSPSMLGSAKHAITDGDTLAVGSGADRLIVSTPRPCRLVSVHTDRGRGLSLPYSAVRIVAHHGDYLRKRERDATAPPAFLLLLPAPSRLFVLDFSCAVLSGCSSSASRWPSGSSSTGCCPARTGG